MSWVGYPDSENTWEPIFNIGAEAIAEYKAAKLARGRRDFSKYNERPADGDEESLFVSPKSFAPLPTIPPGRVISDDDDNDNDIDFD